MKAAILVELGQPLVVDDIDLPEQLSFGQVKVRVKYSGICGAQLNEISGTKGPDKFLPHLLGHEGAGEVLEIGPGVKRIKVGDHVVLHWRKAEGIQCEPPKYTWKGKTVNAGWVTSFNEMAIVSENRLTPIPKNFDLKFATLFGCAITTALGVVNNDAQIKIGQSVVIFGLGGVGLNLCQMADKVGAFPIIGIDLYPQKIEMAKKLGLTQGFVAKSPSEIKQEIFKILGDKGADVVIDTTGSARVIETAYELTHPDGKTILVGVPNVNDKVNIYTLPLHFNKILKGSHGGGVQPDIEIPRLIKLYNADKLELKTLISHEFHLSKINEAIAEIKSGNTARVVIEM